MADDATANLSKRRGPRGAGGGSIRLVPADCHIVGAPIKLTANVIGLSLSAF
jgi:hypothetical protein